MGQEFGQKIICSVDTDDDEIVYFSVRWKNRKPSLIYRTKNHKLKPISIGPISRGGIGCSTIAVTIVMLIVNIRNPRLLSAVVYCLAFSCRNLLMCDL